MRTLRAGLVLSLILTLAMPASAGLFGDEPRLPPAEAAPVSARIAREVDAQRVVGMSVALVRDGAIVHVEHIGWEDREKSIAASGETMYRWASISKPLTAIAAMQLWEAGRLNLDADVRLFVPEFPEQKHTITVRQLLCHQGGILHYGPAVVSTPRPDLDGRYVTMIDAIDKFKASPLLGEPGMKYSYSTHGYILAGAAVERAGGALYAEQVRDRIVKPLAMTTLRPDYQWEAIPHRAVGYRAGPAGEGGAREMVVSSDTDVSWKLAGGGWISNVSDLALLGTGLLSDKLVKHETREAMWTPQKTRDGNATNYGLGFEIGALGALPLVSHGGSQEKVRTLMMILPEQNAAVAIMCNTEGTRLVDLGRDLLGLATTGQASMEPAATSAP
jgi:serine beta-lactamase-like protein LACTB, mitochondrial